MRSVSILLAGALAFGLGACEKKKTTDETGLANLQKGQASASPEPVAAVEDTQEGPAKREEPQPTPAREQLRLLASKGAPEVRSIRAERTEMYGLFSMVEKDEKGEVSALLTAVQGFPWDEDQEALASAPSKIGELAEATTAFAARMKKVGEEQMAEVTAMNKENEERVAQKKSARHSPVKIDKAQRRASYFMKLGRYGGLLARSVLDEARIYAQLGSLAMREELRQKLVGLKDQDLGYEQTNLAAQRVLWELNVPGVEEPSSD